MSHEMPSDFVFTDAEVIALHELPQKLLDLAHTFDKDSSTHLLIDVNYQALQQFQQQTNVGFLWSFELLIHTLSDRPVEQELSPCDVQHVQQFLEHVKTLANNLLEARANILAMMNYAMKE